MARLRQQAGRRRGRHAIVGDDGIDLQVRNAAVHEHEGTARPLDRDEVLRLGHARRAHDQTVDLLSEKHPDGRPLVRHVLAGVREDDVELGRTRDIADAPNGTAEIRILDVADDHADRSRPARGHAAGEFVRLIAERARRGANLVPHARAGGAVVAQHPRRRRLRNAGLARDVLDRDRLSLGCFDFHDGARRGFWGLTSETGLTMVETGLIAQLSLLVRSWKPKMVPIESPLAAVAALCFRPGAAPRAARLGRDGRAAETRTAAPPLPRIVGTRPGVGQRTFR